MSVPLNLPGEAGDVACRDAELRAGPDQPAQLFLDLRERKLAELQAELRRLVRSSAKFGISADDIVRLARQAEGD